MRPVLFLAPVLVLAAGLLTGCGYAGEPKPPELKRPEKVKNLDVAERGDKIIVTFTLPEETTEGLRIAEPPDVELRVGVAPATWNQAEWEKNSDRVAVPAGPWPAPPPKVPRPKKLAKPTVTGKAAKKAKETTAAAKAADQAMLVRTVDIDPTKYADKTVIVGVRVHGPSGQDDGWSRLISLEVEAAGAGCAASRIESGECTRCGASAMDGECARVPHFPETIRQQGGRRFGLGANWRHHAAVI